MKIDHSEIKITEKIESAVLGIELWEGLWKGVTRVAIKKRIDMPADKFLHQAEILNILQHPNVVKLFGVCLQEPIYIVTEMTGQLLKYLRTSTAAKVPTLIDMCAQIANGMAHLESKKCVHRDLSARNIQLTNSNVCKISGFHLAKIINGTEMTSGRTKYFPSGGHLQNLYS